MHRDTMERHTMDDDCGHSYDMFEMDEDDLSAIPSSAPSLVSSSSGTTITDHTSIPSILSSPINITFDEIVAILIILSLLAITALILALCWRCKNHKRRMRTPNNYRDYLLKNPTRADVNVNLKRFSKNSAFEMTNASGIGIGMNSQQSNAERPISYTETLNNFDTVRSYGSAADDLEVITITNNDFIHNLKKNNANNVSPQLNDASVTNAKQIIPIKQEKIQNDAKSPLSSCKMSPPNRASFCGSDLNVSIEERSVTCNSNNAEGYHWDCSDWVMNGTAKPIANILEVSVNEIHDSESNSDNGQIELLINDSQGQKRSSKDHDDDHDDDDHERATLLTLNDKLDEIDYVDKSEPQSPQKYLDMYLPRHSDNNEWTEQRRRTIADFTSLEMDSENMMMNNDDNYSVSVLNFNPDDSNINVCEIEDDDAEYESKSVPKL